jgi:hypothetical protein
MCHSQEWGFLAVVSAMSCEAGADMSPTSESYVDGILASTGLRLQMENTMAKVAAFHSTEPSATVYHDESTCVDGNNIEARYHKSGTAGRPRCARCKEISG